MKKNKTNLLRRIIKWIKREPEIIHIPSFDPFLSNIHEIVNSNRQTGSTTWILSCLLNQPRCIVVCRTAQSAETMFNQYMKSRMFNAACNSDTYPVFCTIDTFPKGQNWPIVFDNGIFSM